MQQRGSLAEPLAEFHEGVAGGGRGDLGVDLNRQSNLAVPQNLHRDARVHVEGGKQRSACLPCAVHGDLGDFRPGDTAVKAAAEVARLDRCAVPGGENQAGVNPGISRVFPVGVLLLPAELECRDAQVGEGEWGLGRFGLGL